MIRYVSDNHKGCPRLIEDCFGRKIRSSYKYRCIGHNASGFHSKIVLHALPKIYEDSELKKTSRIMSALSFRCGTFDEENREIPHNTKIPCCKGHISGKLSKVER